MTAQELKNAILMRAVQGKLVPQDPNDEPASVLLKKIRAEKEQLMKEKKIKKEPIAIIYKDPSDNQHYEKIGKTVKCIEDEIPFEIPESWEWCRLGTVITLLSGQDFQPQYYNSSSNGTPYMTGASNIENDTLVINRWTPQPKNISHFGELLLVCKGSGYGKTVINTVGDIHIARQFMSITPYEGVSIDYINLFLKAKLKEIKKNGQGVIPGIDRRSVLNLMIPIPTVNEQPRIIEKYKTFDVKIDDYDSQYSVLEKINVAMPQKLKASILQYAIRGKLVPQNPDDEPASVLLEHIRAEKEQLIKEGKIKRDKNESYIYRGSDNSYYISFHGIDECIDDE
ncbi:MAG: restriction endonuclease subunit S, partial [Lachnospiraceae bacterium]|nr:restriction endonuclease subunit S [Lachnospiraceae bacterium]